MDKLTQSPSWPAAPRNGAAVVQHPAWEAARNAILDLAAEGPVTVFLTGEPGSGKTWLLRELAASLGEHGFPTMVLLRGDLPVPLGDGVAVLVDEAGYMPEETCASLALQDRGVVVLADIGPFVVEPVEAGSGPVCIHLRLLDAAEIGPFVTEWLKQDNTSPMLLEPGALSRLAEHSGGAVRLVTQLLTAAVGVARASGELQLTAELIDQVAGFRLGETVSDHSPAAVPRAPAMTAPVPPPRLAPVPPHSPAPEPIVAATPTLPPSMPARRTRLRFALTGTALAASVLAAWMVSGLLHDVPSGVVSPQLPPIQSAQSTAPDVAAAAAASVTASGSIQEPAAPLSSAFADQVVPAPPGVSTPVMAPEALPPLQSAHVLEPMAATPVVPPSLAAAPIPVATVPAQIAASRTIAPPTAQPLPIAVASIPKPVTIPVISSNALAATPAIARPAPAGLVLVARPGDTLERLYTDIYHARRAPPFAAVLAANPSKLKPGAIIVFPEPIGGWERIQR